MNVSAANLLALQALGCVIPNMDQLARQISTPERVKAPWLFAAREPALLGPALDYAWPLDEAWAFGELLCAIDEAEGRDPRSS